MNTDHYRQGRKRKDLRRPITGRVTRTADTSLLTASYSSETAQTENAFDST